MGDRQYFLVLADVMAQKDQMTMWRKESFMNEYAQIRDYNEMYTYIIEKSIEKGLHQFVHDCLIILT